MTSILTSRFLINLQQVKNRLAGSTQSVSQISELHFEPGASRNDPSFVGSIGAQLSFASDVNSEDSWDEKFAGGPNDPIELPSIARFEL